MKFERLTVIKEVGRTKNRNVLWLCKCDCGNEKIVSSNDLIQKETRSCGCLQTETRINNGKSRTQHGYSETRIYHIWEGMIERCNNPNASNYKYYGGRIPPITVCDRWDIAKGGSFENFYKDVGDPPKGKSLDRINNDGNYEPNNWRWATAKEQANNRRNNVQQRKKNESS